WDIWFRCHFYGLFNLDCLFNGLCLYCIYLAGMEVIATARFYQFPPTRSWDHHPVCRITPYKSKHYRPSDEFRDGCTMVSLTVHYDCLWGDFWISRSRFIRNFIQTIE